MLMRSCVLLCAVLAASPVACNLLATGKVDDTSGATDNNSPLGNDNAGLQPGGNGGNTGDGSTDSGTGGDGTVVDGGSNNGGDGAPPDPNTGTTPVKDANTPAASGNAMIVDNSRAWSLVGRFDTRQPTRPRFGFAGSKIGVRFTGTSLAVTLSDTGDDGFDVIIDGEHYVTSLPNPADWWQANPALAPVACVPASKSMAYANSQYPGCILAIRNATLGATTTYPIASGLAPGEHTAWLIKRSEFLQNGAGASSGLVTITGFTVDRGAKVLSPPAYFKRRIEFSGDSAITGYGAGQVNPCGYTPRNQDAGRSLPSYTADYLHAEQVNLGSSGQGVYRSFYDYNGDHNLPTLYAQTVPLDKTLPYDFSKDQVDAVVLVAGGDDMWGASGSGDFNNNDPAVTTSARQNFIDAYVKWLVTIRNNRPSAHIYVVLAPGAILSDIVVLGSALQEVVAARTAAGDRKVYYYTFFPQNDPARNPKNYRNVGDLADGEGFPRGCTGHLQPATAKYLARLLGVEIAARMGLSDVGF